MAASYKLFLGVIAFFTLINLLIMNDLATAWSGAEVYNLLHADIYHQVVNLPQKVIEIAGFMGGNHIFSFRLPGVLAFIGGIIGFYFIGQKIFGQATTLSTLVVLVSSLLLVNIAKLATGDIWIAVLHTLAILTQIRYIKQPKHLWRGLHILFLIAATYSAPIETGLLFLIFSVSLAIFHPTGKRSGQLFQWLIYPVLLSLIYFTSFETLVSPSSYLSTLVTSPIGAYFYPITLLSMLPWIGFLIAGLWQTLQRLRKGEELALLTTIWLISALVAHSLTVEWVLALIAAKQLENFLHPNYPKIQENIVKTFSLLNLIGAFIGGMFLMVNAFHILQAVGFRSAMAVGAVYWMPTLFGVIGLYGKNDRLIRSGFAMSGILVMLMFWVQFYPLIEPQRNLPQRIAATAFPVGTNHRAILTDMNNKLPSPFHYSNINYYAYKNGAEGAFPILESKEGDVYSKESQQVIILMDTSYQKLKNQIPQQKTIEVKGWTEKLVEETWWIIE